MSTSLLDTEETEHSLPTVKAAEYVDGYRLRLIFTDGRNGIVNLESLLWGEVFTPLQDVSAFCQFRVDHELGTIVWPNGADVAPDTLYGMI